MLINLTPHIITVYADGQVICTIPPSGTIARVATTQTVVASIDGIPVVKSKFGDVQGLPEPAAGTFYVVSSIVAQASTGRPDVIAPDTGPTAVRDGKQQIAGIVRFQQF